MYKDVLFGEWLPDVASLTSPGCVTAKNVLPLPEGFGPMKSLQTYSNALGGACLGADWFVVDGSIYNFAGDADNLYWLVDGETWTEISQTTDGYTANNWEFVKFGNRIIAMNGTDTPQYFDIGSSAAFADLPGSPPVAKHAAVIRDFLVTGNNATSESQLEWSGYNNTELWTSSLSTQSDTQELYGNAGAIQRITPGEVGYVFQERAIRRMTYVGPPTIFQIDEIELGRGTPSPNSVCWLGANIFYFGQDGFYVFDGQRSTPIGHNKVDRWLNANSDINRFSTMRGAVDRTNKRIYWAFSTSGTSNNRIIVFDWGLGKWSYGEVDTECLSEYVSPGFNLDQLTTILGLADVDSASIPMDSDIYLGGAVTVQAFNTSHTAATFSGAAMTAELETSDFGDGTNIHTVTAIRPHVTGANSTVTVQAGTRGQATENTEFALAKGLNSVGEANCRKRDRYHRFRVNISGGFDDAIGVGVTHRAGGRR